MFPGAVPRTFIGSVLLAWFSIPAIRIASFAGYLSSKSDLQIIGMLSTRPRVVITTEIKIDVKPLHIVRLVLATFNAIGFCLLRRAVSRRFDSLTSVLFVLLTCSQFHLPFWMGRTLPNMFALLPGASSHYQHSHSPPKTHVQLN